MVAKGTGAITPGEVIIPGVSSGKPTPVTVTTVPGPPIVGERAMVATGTTGGAATVKVAGIAGTTPTVAVKVAAPKGAAGSMVTVVAGIAPTVVVSKATV